MSSPEPLSSAVLDGGGARAKATAELVSAVTDQSWLEDPEGISKLDAALEAGLWGDPDERRGVVASLLLRHALAEPRPRARIPAPWTGAMLDRWLSRQESLVWSRVAELLELLQVEEVPARHHDLFLTALGTGLVAGPAKELAARHQVATEMSPAIGALVEEHAPRLLDECFSGIQSLDQQLAAAEELQALASGSEPGGLLWLRQLKESEVGKHVVRLRAKPLADCSRPECAQGYSPLHRRWIQKSGALATPGKGKWGCVRRLVEAQHADHPALQVDWIPRSGDQDWPDRLRAVLLEGERDQEDAAACLPSLGFFSGGGAPVHELLSGAWPSDGSKRLLSPESSGADWHRWVGELVVPKLNSPVALIVAIAERGELTKKELGEFGSLKVQLPAQPEAQELFAAGATGPLQQGFKDWSSSRDALNWSLGLGPAVSPAEHDALLLALLCLDRMMVWASTGSQPLTRPLSLAVAAGPGAGPDVAGAPEDAGAMWSLATHLAAQRLGCDPTDRACIESALMKLIDS
ncbi:hypothetical protein N9F93_00555 [bacterium]|nr:hypothetical protein [bacterium]